MEHEHPAAPSQHEPKDGSDATRRADGTGEASANEDIGQRPADEHGRTQLRDEESTGRSER